jgi:nicotinate phosphoribosyltransferase
MATPRKAKRASVETHIGLLSDKYELTMLEGFLKAGIAGRKATFELFGRKLPEGRSYGVVAGTERAIEAILSYKFSETDLDYLHDFLDPETLEYLAAYSFSGTVLGYAEGDYWFPYSPILTINATLGEAVILETLLLSIFNYDSAVASAASQLTLAAKGKHISELGSRRASEQSAVVAARAAYIAGFDATSNLEAGRRYGIPVFGTSAHAFTLAFPDEVSAFTAQVEALGAGTTLLVDTYDIEQGVINAIEVAGPGLGAVRIDSGDPFEVIPTVRKQLDELGATETKIVLSGDLDRKNVKAIIEAELPVDSFGVGTAVVTGDGYPAAGFVYKLVSIEDDNGFPRPVAKASAGTKKSIGGAKTAYREYDDSWQVVGEHLLTDDAGTPIFSDWDRLQQLYVNQGKIIDIPRAEEAREKHASNRADAPVSIQVASYVNDDQVWLNPAAVALDVEVEKDADAEIKK